MDIRQLYEKAIERFNAGDIEGMAETWDDNIIIRDATDGHIVAHNKAQAISIFKKQFRMQPTHITVEKTEVMGNKLVSFEREFDQDNHETDAICILECEDDHFKKVYWVF